MSIPFSDIKNSDNKLFQDYLYDFPKVADYFAVNPRDPGQVKLHLSNTVSQDHDRSGLAAILTRQNTLYGNSPLALENIQKLADEKTVAVVTGQQAGFFSGPLYTIYKALGAVKLCAFYQNRFPGFQFVPVFWMELEDHDFEEVRSVGHLTIENEIKKIKYDGGDPANELKNPIHKIVLDSDIGRVIREITSVFNRTDFSDSLFQNVENAYAEGNSVGGAFAKWMAFLLGKFGLILMDPSDPDFKKLARPIFRKELENASAVHERLTEQSRALTQAGFAVQVETQPVNLFLLDDKTGKLPFNVNARNKFRLSLDDTKNHGGPLQEILEQTPERFIPNVVLRPVVQDFLLPTFAYIGGPSEIAYFAQFKTIYGFFGVTEPMIVPRPFVTLLEKKNKKVLDKYGVTLTEVFNEASGILERVALKSSGVPMASRFEDFLATTKAQFSEIEKQMIRIDPTLKGAAATALEKITQAVKVLESKSGDAEKRNLELTHSQLSKALTHLVPNGNFQERELNVLYYLNKYGMTLIDTVYQNIDPESCDHQVVEL